MQIKEQNGFTVLIPSEGYKLMKDGIIFPDKIYLGINDKPEYYTEILNEIKEETKEIQEETKQPIISFDENGDLIIIKPNGEIAKFTPNKD